MSGRGNGLPMWWTGPWRILPECPATGHNVFRRVERPVDGIKCICPRAQALFNEYLEMKRQESREGRRKGRRSIMPTLRPIIEGNRGYAAPNWKHAACNTDVGRKLSDRAYDAVSSTDFAERQRLAMRILCSGCPIETVCRGWVLAEERPAGSWGGVWGGLDPAQRAAIVSRRPEPSDAGSGASDGTQG